MLSESEIGIRNTLLIREGKLLALQNEGYNTLCNILFFEVINRNCLCCTQYGSFTVILSTDLYKK